MLASYRRKLVQLSLQPKTWNGSLIANGNWETLFAAIKHCHRQINRKDTGHVACTFNIETSQVNS